MHRTGARYLRSVSIKQWYKNESDETVTIKSPPCHLIPLSSYDVRCKGQKQIAMEQFVTSAAMKAEQKGMRNDGDLKVEHLKKTYGEGENAVHALDDVSFSVEKG